MSAVVEEELFAMKKRASRQIDKVEGFKKKTDIIGKIETPGIRNHARAK